MKLALVGYTNAGKSTLLNRLTGAGVLAENKLFATLDATTRKLELPSGQTVLLTDTVGFIRKLPHHLVKAFRSTLDEVRYADVLLVVCDSSDAELHEQLEVTKTVISDLGGADKPVIFVNNKSDLIHDARFGRTSENTVNVSGCTGEGIDDLLLLIEQELSKFRINVKLIIPYTEQSVLSRLYNEYTLGEVEYLEEGISVEVSLDQKGQGQYAAYIVRK